MLAGVLCNRIDNEKEDTVSTAVNVACIFPDADSFFILIKFVLPLTMKFVSLF